MLLILLWGCPMGMKRAWDKELPLVQVFCYSNTAIELIGSAARGVSDMHEDSTIVHEIRSLLQRDWQVEFVKTDGEDNGVADSLAKQAS